MVNSKKLSTGVIGYKVSVSQDGKVIAVSTTTLNLNLLEVQILEFDSKQLLHEKFVIDFTTSMRYNQPYSCFGFMSLDFKFEGE